MKNKTQKWAIKWLLMTFCDLLYQWWLIHHQRNSLLQQMGTNTEIHSETLCREWLTFTYSALNGVPLLKAQWTLWKRGQRWCESQKEWWRARKQGPLVNMVKAHMDLTETEVACTGPVCVHYGFLSIHYWIPKWKNGSMIPMLSLGLFCFCLFNFNVLAFGLPY